MKQMQQNDPAAGQQTQPEKGSEAAAAPEQKEKKTPQASASAPVPMPDPTPLQVPASVKRNRRRRLIRRILAAVAVVAVVVGVFLVRNRKQDEGQDVMASYETVQVERRTITEELTGTGTLAPAESYVLTSLVSGDIINAPFEEGDIVEKDTTLYQVDNSTVSHSVEQGELSLQQSQRSYEQALQQKEDLNIKATRGGTVVSLDVKQGDTVAAGQQVATIRNSAVMNLTVPFHAADAAGFYVGQPATVTMDGSFETLSGTITTVGAEEVLDGGRPVRQITIQVQNPGAIAPEQTATAMVGSVACSSSGTFAYSDEVTVMATIGGDVAQINVQEGDTVAQDQVLVVLTSEELDNQIANSADAVRNAELALEGQVDQMGDYVITSPISGTIIEKNYKAGDKLESGKTLCTVFDLSYLKMTMNVDELDVNKVQVGQQVTITADAAEGQTYTGTVTKVSINGTTTNGVTTYPVTIQIDSFDGLLPGMNVDATIQVESRENVLAVPVGAVSRGNRVLVQTDEETGSQQSDESGTPPDGGVNSTPAGFTYKEVTLGISDQDYIEVTDGLEEGETIAVVPGAGGSTEGNMDMGMPMEGGGPPAGGGEAVVIG